jgi:hypothetical protein
MKHSSQAWVPIAHHLRMKSVEFRGQAGNPGQIERFPELPLALADIRSHRMTSSNAA